MPDANVLGKTDPLPPDRELAIAVGKFDGVHLGHRQMLAALRRLARRHDLDSLAIALDPHPLAVLSPGNQPSAINCPADRLRLLASLDLDYVKLMEFDARLAAKSARDFIAELTGAGLKLLVAGANTRIGRAGAAGPEQIREICQEFGVALAVVPIVSGDINLSTGNLRAKLAAGDLDAVGRITGRLYSLQSKVVVGAGRGSQLGFATANLVPDPALQLPPDGVYAVTARLADRPELWPGVANLGIRPTFDGAMQLLEVHLFDYENDLRGCNLRVFFKKRLRSEKRFAGSAQLVVQIKIDCDQARAIPTGKLDGYRPWVAD